MKEILSKHFWKIAIVLGAIGGAIFGHQTEGPGVGAALGGAIFWAIAVALAGMGWVMVPKLFGAGKARTKS